MRKQTLLVLICIGVAILTSINPCRAASETTDSNPEISCSPVSIPAPPSSRVGSFIGVSGDALILAGGKNLDGNSTDVVDLLPLNGSLPRNWRTFHLHEKLAWGASVVAGDSLICIGGEGDNGCEKSVIRLCWRDGKLVEDQLADLPQARAWAGAAMLDGVIYVAGGVTNSHAAAASNDLLSLDITDPQARWKRQEPLPGAPRVQPAVIGQYYGLEVFGGRTAHTDSSGQQIWDTLSDCWVYRPKPLDFTTKQGWIRLADLPAPLAGGAAVASGQAHTILLGADAQLHVSDLETAWKTAQCYLPILAYHAVTDTWCGKGTQNPYGPGQAAVAWNNQQWLVGAIGPGNSIQQLSVHSYSKMLHFVDYAVIVGYFLLITIIGITFSRRQKTTDQFAVGGRGTPWWVAALSIYATATSSISLMAVPALTYSTNLIWLFQPIISIVVLIPQAFLVIPMIRRLNLTSTYEYLEKRFNPALRLAASLQCIIFYTIGRASVVILIPSIAISAVTGVNVYYAIFAVGLLTTIYTSLGGIEAVMWTDVLQAAVMLLGPLIIVLTILFSLPGGVAKAIEVGSHYGKFDLAIWSWNATEPVAWIMILTVLLTITGFAGDQAQVQRVLSTPNVKAARKATIGNWVVCVGGAFLVQIMGVLLFVYFHTHPAQLDPTMQNDRVVPLFVVQVMPAGVAGLIIAGIFAASMSCLSATVNSAATLMVQDFYVRWRPESSDRTRLRLMKILSYVVGILATSVAAWLADMPMRSLMETWTTIWSLCGAGFVGVYTLGIFSRRATSSGALIGAIFSVIFTFFIQAYTPLHWTLFLPLAVVCCIVVGYGASLFSAAPVANLDGLTAFTLQGTEPASKVRPAALASVAS